MKKNIYTETYRPSNLDEVVGQSHILPFLKQFAKNKDIPHLLFAGPPGTGKTTCAIALAKELFGEEWKSCFLEINASDDRGINVVRTKIKDYARIKIISHDFKVIFLDECEMLTSESQYALRRIIEKYSDKCRFILSCNYPSKIIDPIIDRCVVFRFRKIEPADMKLMLMKVVEKENIDITHSAVFTLATLSNGSMRKAMNVLEKLKLGNLTKINDDVIYSNFCYVNDDQIKMLLNCAKEGDIAKVEKFIDSLLNQQVYEPKEIIDSLWRTIKESSVLTKDFKLQALSKIGDIEFRISEGSSPEIQLKTYIVYLMQLYEKVVGN